jgi:FAD/FMN-containing dehydrogenase
MNEQPRDSASDASGYAARRDAAAAALRASLAGGERIGLAKDTSNLFRDRAAAPRRRLDVSAFTHVLRVDREAGEIEVEGMTPYDALVDATLPHALMPAVVPQLKSITIGGAVSGIGIESSSFRHGLVHESVRAMDVLLADGSVVTATPDNEHADLYHGVPNSYGTLGYVLRLVVDALPVRSHVHLRYLRHADPAGCFAALGELAQRADPPDFLDGVVFGPRELVLCVGRHADQAPYTSDYTGQRIYYRSIRERDEDWLTTRDYLWRWDTDWFWCSKNLYAQHPLVRRLLGRRRLNSRFYTRVMRWNSRVGLTRRLSQLLGQHPESVIQDVDIPLSRCAEFLDFLCREIGILPVWLCPIRAPRRDAPFPLYPIASTELMVNFGFWDVVRSPVPRPPGHYNRLVERKVIELGGIKSLYSDSYFTRAEFDAAYGATHYAALKARYDPHGRLPDLYGKCVARE